MEDDDFTIDQEGRLDLRYRGWSEIDSTVFSMVQQIEILDVSFNQMETLPDEIGLLKKMTIFNCACNALTQIPSSIGRLRKLKELKLNGNKVSTLPIEIRDCHRLCKLYLNENRLETLPDSIGDCSNLSEINLQNNSLHSLPFSLVKLKETLQVLKLENNEQLSIIPSQMQGNTSVSMWIICLLADHFTKISIIRNATLEMSVLSQKNKDEIEETLLRIHAHEEEQRNLIAERNSVNNFITARRWYRIGKIKIRNMKHFLKKMLNRESRISVDTHNVIRTK